MNLPTEVFGQVVVVHTPDELGTDQATGVESFIRNVDRVQVVVDLDNTEMIDSAGLAMLLDVQDEFRQRGGDVKIATNNASNRKILEITRLEQQLEVFDSVIDAVKSFQC